jgi:hypothetical protein
MISFCYFLVVDQTQLDRAKQSTRSTFAIQWMKSLTSQFNREKLTIEDFWTSLVWRRTQESFFVYFLDRFSPSSICTTASLVPQRRERLAKIFYARWLLQRVLLVARPVSPLVYPYYRLVSPTSSKNKEKGA